MLHLQKKRPNISLFSSPATISFSLHSLGGLLVVLWWCLKRPGPEMCTFGVLGLSCEAPAAPKPGGPGDGGPGRGAPGDMWQLRRRPSPPFRLIVLRKTVYGSVGRCFLVFSPDPSGRRRRARRPAHASLVRAGDPCSVAGGPVESRSTGFMEEMTKKRGSCTTKKF